MKTNFYIARHYWKDRENASWQIAGQFPSQLLEEIKAEYSSLESEQPEYRQYNGGTVFFVYEEAEDIYGRKITEITAATCGKRLQNPGNVTTEVLEMLHSRVQERLDFDLELGFDPYKKDSPGPTANIKKGSAITLSGLFKIVALAIFVLILLGGWFFIQRSKYKSIEISQTGGSERQERTQTSANAQITDQSANTARPESKPNNKTVLKSFCDKYNSIKPVPPYIDKKCVQLYINEQCDQRQKRQSYNKWLKKRNFENMADATCNGVKAVENISYVTLMLKKQYGLSAKLIKDFFDGK